MARRTVLTSRQRSALFSLPQREADLLRHYTLSDEDLQNIGAPRRPRNKLGFALQLCVLRYPGRFLAAAGERTGVTPWVDDVRQPADGRLGFLPSSRPWIRARHLVPAGPSLDFHRFRSRCARSRLPSPCPPSGRRASSSSATRDPRSAARAPASPRSTSTP